MKVKEIDRTANVAWSPSNQHPAFLAAGTPAQQLDASFSTLANLELYMLDLTDSALEMPLSGSIETKERCCKLIWGSLSLTPDATEVGGLIVAGTDNGNVCLYNPQKILHQRGGSCEDALVLHKENHVGKVQALAFNNFQQNLLATGGGDSDIFIWDLNQMETPMTPGTKSQPSEDVQSLAWNNKVQHILGSTFANRCVVWDLRKSDPVIKLTDSMTKMKCREICWHPEVATRLCLSSEDDHTPFIQLWDLRYATSPVHSLERHTKGVNSIAWCSRDPDLLLSCGKDNLLYCWNPNSAQKQGELVYEMRLDQEWAFDVAWCPRNPALVSTASFDGHVSLYSVMGGRGAVSRGPPKRVMDSFPSEDDPFAQVGQPKHQQEDNTDGLLDDSPCLRKAPKWLKKPCGARFAFGGKLISFSQPNTSSSLFGGSTSEDTDHGSQRNHRLVIISQMITEQELIERATQLDNVVEQSSMEVLEKFCEEKVSTANHAAGTFDKQMWSFLKAHFEEDTRSAFMELLGFGEDLVNRRIKNAMIIGKENHSGASKVDSEFGESLSLEGGEDSVADISKGSEDIEYDEFDQISGRQQSSGAGFLQVEDTDMGLGSQLQLSVVEDGVDSALSIALLSGHLDRAVDLCLRDDRAGEAIILAVASGNEELYRKTQSHVLSKLHTDSARLIQTVVTRDWRRMMEQCAIENWKEALACALTYASSEEFTSLCERLGERLESEKGGDFALNACLCYICCGNVEKLVRTWQRCQPVSSPGDLQALMEMIVILRKALDDEGVRDSTSEFTTKLFNRYANLLAAQGRLATALHYLGNETESSLLLLRDRIYRGLDQVPPNVQPPPCPFQMNQVPGPAAQPQPVKSPAQPTHSQVNKQPNSFYQPGQSDRNRTASNSSGQHAPYYQPNNQPQSSAMFQPAVPQPGANTMPPPPISAAAAVSQKSAQRYPPGPASYTTSSNQPFFNPGSQPSSGQPGLPPPPVSNMQSNFYPSNPSRMSPAASLPPPPPSGPVQKIGHSSGPGWNDPPIVSQNYKPAAPVEPVVNNFYNPAAFMPDNSAPPCQPNTFQPPRPPAQSMMQPPLNQPTAPRSTPSFQPSPVHTLSNPANGGDSTPMSAKANLPAEYKVMEEALGALVNACRQANPSNRQLKMKMDDVDKKLECLYVELSGGSLSPPVLSGLQAMVAAVQHGDYSAAALHVNAIIQQANFSEVRPFITGLKVLMQSAEKTLMCAR